MIRNTCEVSVEMCPEMMKWRLHVILLTIKNSGFVFGGDFKKRIKKIIIFDTKVAEKQTNITKTSFLFLLTVFLRSLRCTIIQFSLYSPLINTSQHGTLFPDVHCKFRADTFTDPHKVSRHGVSSAARFRLQWVNWEQPSSPNASTVGVGMFAIGNMNVR